MFILISLLKLHFMNIIIVMIQTRDTNIVAHNNNTHSSSQNHPSKASTHNSKSKTILSIFNQNIRGLFNKPDELVTSWSTEAPHIL